MEIYIHMRRPYTLFLTLQYKRYNRFSKTAIGVLVVEVAMITAADLFKIQFTSKAFFCKRYC